MPRRAVAGALTAFLGVRLLVLLTLVLLADEQGRSAYQVLVKWDAQWYRGIAENGYGAVRLHDDGRLLADYAFFPLFPWLERAISNLTGLTHLDAGLVVSAASSMVAAGGIFAVARLTSGDRVAVVTTVLWAALPAGVVQSMAYSESLFTALAAWALYAVLTGRWVLAGALACGAGLTRPVGLAVVAAVVVPAALEYLRARRVQSTRRARTSTDVRPLVGALVAPLGWFGYVAWVGVEVGSPTGYFTVAAGWGNGFDGGAAFTGWTWRLLTGPSPFAGVIVILGVAALGGLLWQCWRQRQPLPLLIYCGVLVALALTTSGYFGSRPRHLVPAFPLLLPVAVWAAGLRLWLSTTVLAGLALIAAAYGAAWLLGQGPP